jgi:hypothetical protein
VKRFSENPMASPSGVPVSIRFEVIFITIRRDPEVEDRPIKEKGVGMVKVIRAVVQDHKTSTGLFTGSHHLP